MTQSNKPTSPLHLATVIGLGVLVLINGMTWVQTRGLRRDLNESFTKINAAMATVAAKAAAAPAAAQRPQGPDPNKVYTVNTNGSPAKGPANAPVVIAEFSDFQCPFCSRVGPTIKKIEQVYGDKVRVVWKNNPLTMHKDAPLAHVAAMAAHEQGKFWEYHDKLFADQKLKNEDLMKKAQEIGLDMKKFQEAMATQRPKPLIDADVAEATKLGATGTPAFFINGRYLSGAVPFEKFAPIINAELTRLNIPIPPQANVGG